MFLELGLDREAGAALGVLLREHLPWRLLDPLLHDLLELQLAGLLTLDQRGKLLELLGFLDDMRALILSDRVQMACVVCRHVLTFYRLSLAQPELARRV